MRGAIEIETLSGQNLLKPYKVFGWVNGERRRLQFKTHDEALTTKQNWEREIANLAPLPSITTRLTEAQAREAEAVFHRLEGSPLSLTLAVDYALKNYRPAAIAKALVDAVALFLEEQEKLNCRPDTLRNLKVRLNAFARFTGAANVGDIAPERISAFLFRVTDNARAARTIINDRLALSNFFNWCMSEKQRFCASNPVASVKPPKVRGRHAPKTLTLAQSRLLMASAVKYNDGAAVPYFCLCLFGGVRPKEATRLTWDMIDLKKGRIDLGVDVAKTGEHRFVSLTPNMVDWLAPHQLQQTPIKPGRYAFDRVREALGFADWPEDIMRHTAVSNFLRMVKPDGTPTTDSDATERHGHSISVMLRHYRDRVTPEDAKEFWDIRPGNIGQLVPWPVAEAKAA